MIPVLGVVLTCLISMAPLLIAVAGAVLFRSSQRRADARRIVQLLSSGHPTHRRRKPR